MSGPSALLIFIAAIVTNNILLTNFLGACSFLACSRRVGTALGLGAAVTTVMACTTAINWCVYQYVLLPMDLRGLRYIVFIAVIAAFVQLAEMVIERFSPSLYYALGIFLPLITVNCAVLGVCLFMVIRAYDFGQSFAYGVGAGLGWTLAIVLMAGLRKKMSYSDIPGPFRGLAINMIVTGVMAMAFLGFAGMVK